MADLEFYQDDSDENSEDDYGFDGGISEVEDLTPLQRLEKYLDNDNIYNRQMLARGLLDTLRAVCESGDNCVAVLDAMTRLSEDPEPSVRSELMEQVPHVAVYCQENIQSFVDAVPKYILPMVVRYLNDANSQVRKTSQAALLVLLEQELVEKGDIEQQVMQVILELAAPESLDDYRSEAVALMSKMAPLLGKDITDRHFLPRFSEMCTDPLFHVRKVCAANFGEMASVVGVQNSEDILLPKFFFLCEDGVWGVRKACAECFMTVSCACSLEIRRNELANLFVNLLCDQSRWVRMSAFQQLGPFISTFADADRTDLVVSEDGILSFQSRESCNDSESDGTVIHSSLNLYSGDKDFKTEDLSGILQLKSLDPPNMPTESSSDPFNTSNNSQALQNEGMCIDSEDVIEEDEKGRLAFSEENKSAEELRADVWLATLESDDHIKTNEDIGKSNSSLGLEGLNLHDDAQTFACDSSSASNGAINSCNSVQDNKANDRNKKVDEFKGLDDQEAQLSKSSEDSPVPCENMSSTAASGDGKSISNDNNVPSQISQAEAPSGNGAGDKSSVEAVATPVHIHLDNNFNTFQYWRSPLPEVNIDFDIINGQPTNIHVVAKVKDDDNNKVYASEMNVSISDSSSAAPSNDSLVTVSSSSPTSSSDSRSSSLTSSVLSSHAMSDFEKCGVRIHTASVSTVSDAAEETVAHIGSTHVLGQHLGEQHLTIVDGIVQDMSGSSLSFMDDTSSLEFGMDDATLAQQQSIVPQPLLENYLGMVDPSRAQTVDGEITKHCAYNLPAVAYTLGRQNWHCIKNLYETLAQDMQWKVRRTLAFSIHELALIVGEEITHKDLVPVFDGFLKDLDEVRIGVLKHLAEIFKLLRPEVRLQYLAKTQEFMKTDNNKNWRFREELAEQLIQICCLFHCIDVVNHIVPLAMAMLMDKVAQVRLVALRLVSAVLKKTCDDGEKKLLASVCNNIIERFATDYRWLLRQTFAQLCYVILEEDALPPNVFAKNFLPSVLALSSDPVPNVRLSLSKVMAQRIMPLDYFTTQQNPYHEDLVQTQQKLQSDVDKDVRYFSCQQPETDISHDHDMVPV
ncbi:hypothetical protein RRG08_026297 [Elysia crispata]|uniref:Serine/threonine-protein phosphatase 4 regulatory subunit 1 n=1 Tax=Elysia crispata TaxID=231223 RepID=A0AAE0ZAN0_9GAST|nr:hypothetical protein RRG08_026297 [Elysia crispata]